MDRFIRTFPGVPDDDLVLCREHGVAYQADMTPRANYDAAYYSKCASYENSEIAKAINAGRAALVAAHAGTGRVLDIGVGSGEFVRYRPNTWGFDVNPVAIEWLKRNDLFSDRFGEFAGYTFWDVIEHVPDPSVYFDRISLGAYLLTSIPIMYGLSAIRLSKHYRPGEHLYYFTDDGFRAWMRLHGFLHLTTQSFEIAAGRESIYSYAFKRIAWPRVDNPPKR